VNEALMSFPTESEVRKKKEETDLIIYFSPFLIPVFANGNG
jgi:hypothetical protein